MKKKLVFILVAIIMVFSMFFGFSACSINNIVKYTYTNSQGETSYFEIDFDKNEYTYSGNAWYRQGWGYKLWSDTNYTISSSIYYSHTVNGYKLYNFHDLPICYKYATGISEDGSILRVEISNYLIYEFSKEG